LSTSIVSLLGSPSARSRSSHLLQQLEDRLGASLEAPFTLRRIAVRDLPAHALLHADASDPALAEALNAVREARVLLVATPIYKAAYSGLLKAFLDLLPQDALRGKTVVPLATGGSVAHLLALDYALKPVLGALGARDIRDAIYASDAQLPSDGPRYDVTPDLDERLDRVADDLLTHWHQPARAVGRRAEPRLAAATPLPVRSAEPAIAGGGALAPVLALRCPVA
jgi:FMN reductase